MARRRLEMAIQAGRAIDSEMNKSGDGKFTKVYTTKELDVNNFYMGVYSLQFSHDAKYLAVGCGNSAIQLYNAETGAMFKDLNKGGTRGLPVMSLVFHPLNENQVLSAGSDGHITFWDIATSLIEKRINEEHNEINALDFSLSGNVFATAGSDQNIRLYETEAYELLTVYESSHILLPDRQVHSHHGLRVFALKFHPEKENIFVTGGWDDCLKVWDKRTSIGVQRTISGPHICGNSIDIKDGKILTGSWVSQDALQVWDLGSGQLEAVVGFPCEHDDKGGGGEYLYCAQFADNNVVLAGGSGTNSVQAINRVTQQVVGEVELNGKAVQALDSVNGGRVFAVGGAGNSLKIARME